MLKEEKVCVVTFTDRGLAIGKIIQKEFQRSKLYTTRQTDYTKDVLKLENLDVLLKDKFQRFDVWIFVGALGICVRSIAPYIQDKLTDPAVINIDEQGRFVQSVLSGHAGGANDLTKRLGRMLQAQPVITTSSDLQEIWALDLLAEKFGWSAVSNGSVNEVISLFVNNRPTALILKVKDAGASYLERTKPDFADVFYDYAEVDQTRYELLIYVGYQLFESTVPAISFYPACLSLGTGCSKDLESAFFEEHLLKLLVNEQIAYQSIAVLTSVDIKAGEQAYMEMAKKYSWDFITYPAEDLGKVPLANPSDVVLEKIGILGVSESSSALAANTTSWLVEKTKAEVSSGKMFTHAVCLISSFERRGQIAIVGAGPGAPEYITLKGKELLEAADCILYAGSLVPEELTAFAKPAAMVRNSASMTLEEQVDLMDLMYRQGKLIVRLHSGDPSIYGAIQEQMTIFDERNYDYFIVPGISSFQAAAAYLRSEFTIPEVAQTIILTRGEGNTPMPEHEKLEEMAKLRATMCIFLSAGIINKVEGQLLQHYPPETPVAVLFRVSWKDEQVWTGKLDELSRIIKSNKLTRTVLVIVGEAIGARKNRSWLYGDNWHHIFRKKDNISGKKNKTI
ncbi:precorrin-4 C(11)-methyltransferase [Pedobacter hartonius]|uniref:Precorrin-4 C11-methyltransferase n=1 Tax=Pedobacter hartonius TaxID=425514 RepID=A0A1H4EUE6_9SPHI|nr:precorrin-4 C(11)-methyltransferase [Pedobacter hartonius]SEA88556.1 precorrin-4 C11-methyltransferase [Pedobacter hartonius]